MKTTFVQETFSVDARQIAAWLKSVNRIPEGAEVVVEFRVPGGGDYSNRSLDLDENPLSVHYTLETTEA